MRLGESIPDDSEITRLNDLTRQRADILPHFCKGPLPPRAPKGYLSRALTNWPWNRISHEPYDGLRDCGEFVVEGYKFEWSIKHKDPWDFTTYYIEFSVRPFRDGLD